eukprot:TRINITY_DN16043_c0_g1_i1.p1 TRINITY_DN16043_c0_g1~~TRINITY_DN16043_c0_g1_i1.p1  ORF type:complete len:373 (-),score=43.70 TRINITY_DN16043_c0_g1_i1:32-1150(-)
MRRGVLRSSALGVHFARRVIQRKRLLHVSSRVGSVDIDFHGGRSSNSGVIATVFGASGFLGRVVVNNLGKIGSQIVIPFRGEEHQINHLKLTGDLGQIVPIWYSPRDDESIKHAMKHSNVVVNLIGSKFATKNYSLADSNALIPAKIAEISAEVGVDKFIHVSALNADLESSSEFARVKAQGEVLIKEHRPDAVFLRPADIFGINDFYLHRLAQMCLYWPVVPDILPNRKIQPLWCDDFAKAVLNSIASESARGHTFNLGGPVVTTQRELLDMVSRYIMRDIRTIPVETLWMKQLYSVLQWTLRKPRYSVAELEYMQSGDGVVPEEGHPIQHLGIETDSLASVEDTAMAFLRGYRPPTLFDAPTPGKNPLAK